MNQKFNTKDNLIFYFRAKNGTVYFNKSGQIYIERKGWFDTPYQWFTRGETLFTTDDIEQIVIEEPGMMRGYMDFILKNGKRKARVWLTQKWYIPYATTMKNKIEAKMRHDRNWKNQ